MINVAVSGAAGRMGATVCEAVEAADDMSVVGRADPQLDSKLADVLGDADVVVDFTTPDAALGIARTCLEAGVHCVVGTTGVDFSELAGVGSANLFVAPNFAIGAVLMMEVSKYGFGDVLGNHASFDPSRVGAQVVTGIGFIGAGIIFVHRGAVRGLTTASTALMATAIGLACGAGLPALARMVTALQFRAHVVSCDERRR